MLGSPQKLVQNSPEGFWWGIWTRILPTMSVRSWQHYKNQHSSHQTRIPSAMSCWLFQTEGSQTSSTRRWMIYTHEVTISITATLTSPNQGFVCLLAIFNDELVPSVHCLPSHSPGKRPKYWQEKGLPGQRRSSPRWGNLPNSKQRRKKLHCEDLPLENNSTVLLNMTQGIFAVRAGVGTTMASCKHSLQPSLLQFLFQVLLLLSTSTDFLCSEGLVHPKSARGRGRNYLPRLELLLCEQRQNDQFFLIADLSLWGFILFFFFIYFFAFMALCLLHASVSYKP